MSGSLLSPAERERVRGWDRRLTALAKRILVLGPLSWPSAVEDAFFEALDRGQRVLPSPPPVGVSYAAERAALSALIREVEGEGPLGAFLGRTARSYRQAAEMMESAAKPAFTTHGQRIYGSPRAPIAPGAPSHLQAAEQCLRLTEGMEHLSDATETEELDADAAAAWMTAQIARYFAEPLAVVLDDELIAKSSAGAQRVRLRGGTRYAEETLAQLLEHEVLVHAATKRNGQAQPLLGSLGLSAPRTTTTQEGLATLAELITDTMDVQRLRRIALRIRALDGALQGADFLEVYDLFVAHGQTEVEAFRSAARIFRGGDVRGGGIVFLKDVVYFKGLSLTHAFFLKALQHRQHHLPLSLFAGRMTLGDVVSLAPYFEAGDLIGPQVAPGWVQSRSRLAAYLAWARVQNTVPLSELSLLDLARADADPDDPSL